MSGLVLKLRPAERIMINGAVIENGDRRSRLNVLTPRANVLRLRDAIHPDQANTPVRRICYLAQLVLAGEMDASKGRAQLKDGIRQLQPVFANLEARKYLTGAAEHLASENDYQALKLLRHLIPIEDSISGAAT